MPREFTEKDIEIFNKLAPEAGGTTLFPEKQDTNSLSSCARFHTNLPSLQKISGKGWRD